MPIYHYAQINDDGLCIAVSQLVAPMDAPNLIALAAGQDVLGCTWDGQQWSEPVPTPSAVQQITRRQGLLALFDARGITESDIQAVIDAIEDEAIRYKAGVEFNAHHWQKDNPIVASFALALAIEPNELHDLFNHAATL